MQTLDKVNFRVFTCTLDMQAYHEVVSKGAHLPDKLNLLVRYCADTAVSWFFQKYCDRPGEHLSVYFDRGERFKGRFETRAMKKKKLSRLVNGWHLIDKIEAVDMKDTPGLQLADFMAWVQNRRLVFAKENTTGKYGHMAQIAEGVLPFTRLDIDGVMFERMAVTCEIAPYLYRDQDIEE